MRFILRCCFAIALATTLQPSVAAAQDVRTAALLPAFGGDREIPEADREAAYQAALEFLRTEDILVLERHRVESSLTPEQQGCVSGQPCAAAIRAALGVDILVGLVIWGTPDAPDRASSVHASVLDMTGTRFVGSATVQRELSTAIRDALRSALRDQRAGPGPYLEVKGTRGALALLDGSAIGSIPLRVATTPGAHELHVRMDGHEPQTLTVTVTDDPARTTEVLVELRPGGESSGPTPRPATNTTDNWPSWLLAGGLGAAGLALVAIPIPTLVDAGQCVDAGPGGQCRESVAIDARTAVLLGLGSALIVAGVVVAITQPITVDVSASADGARIQLRGSF